MEPVSPSHSALIISVMGKSTLRIERVLHGLNISHRYAALDKENPSGMDFLWDIYEFNFDLVVVLDEGFSENFYDDILKTICNTDFKGIILLVSSRRREQMVDCILIPDDDGTVKRLEEAISFFIKE